jgi:hypothetical protein
MDRTGLARKLKSPAERLPRPVKANCEVAQRQPEGGGHPLAWFSQGHPILET